MSRPSTESATRSKQQNSGGSKPILLIDHTKPQYASDDEPLPDVAEDDLESPISPTKSTIPISPRLTRVSLREELAKRKWAKYQEDRVGGKRSQKNSDEIPPGEVHPVTSDQDSVEASNRWGESTLQRGRRKAREAKDTALRRKPTFEQKPDGDAVVDVLYENQRGSFFCGIPLFSSRSLLNFDPPAWVDALFKPSAVNITNAQVPDPSWTWDWRTWYVDMSRDVDEEGWEYSFWFQKGFSWHGTHPWFHSFVRRRRWLRKRVRRKQHTTQEKAHALNADYFTIHTSRAKSPASSTGTGPRRASSVRPSSVWGAKSWLEQEGEVTIPDIPALMAALRKAAVDREKIVYVKAFLDQGGDELFYLAREIPSIMSLFVFQNSRRQLLSLLMHKFDEATAHRDEHEKRGEAEEEREKRYIDNLLNAVNTADEQCKKLEYWSDVRDVVRKGETIGATHDDHGWGHEWAGIDTRPDPDAAEHSSEADEKSPTTEEKGKGRATEERAEKGQKAPGSWIDGTSEQKPKRDMEEILSDEDERPGRLSEDEGGDEPETKDKPENAEDVEDIRERIIPEEARRIDDEHMTRHPDSEQRPTAESEKPSATSPAESIGEAEQDEGAEEVLD